MKPASFADLGVGVGLRPPHFDDIKNTKPQSISWVEVISENFMAWQNRGPIEAPLTLLEIRKNYPVMLHGVSLSVGSAEPLDSNYLQRLKDLIQLIEPTLVSDHLCWTGLQGQNLHDLLPVPYTQEALTLITGKIQTVQDFLGRRILIENASSYLEFQDSEMSEWDFISALTARADCGLLLDINNVYVSSVNHGFNPKTYLKNIPHERIGQIHLAGHSRMKDGYLIDTHDHPVCSEVWDLYRWFTREYGKFSTMIERDDNIPSWSELEQELHLITAIREETQNESALQSL